MEKWPKCNEQHCGTLGGFLGVGASSGGSWRLSWERFGGYVGRWWLRDVVFLAILGDVWTSWRQGWRTRAQDAADDRNSWIFGGLEGGGGDARGGPQRISGTPLRTSTGRGWSSHLHPEAQPGGSTWKLLELLELKLWMETSKTTASQHVPKGTWRILKYNII